MRSTLILGAILLLLVGLYVLHTYDIGAGSTASQPAANRTKGSTGGAANKLAASDVPIGPVDSVFVHRATSKTISGNSTYLNNRLINGSPDATILVTQNWNPGKSGGVYNAHPVGVWYDHNRKRWAIFNEDRADLPAGASFNVVVLSGSSTTGYGG